MMLSEARFLLARSRLSLIVQEKAADLATVYGIGYVPADDAPRDVGRVPPRMVACQTHENTFPCVVWCIRQNHLLRPEDNHAFRFWHDMIHVHGGQGMSLTDELAIASMHVKHVANLYGKDSPEAALMAVDTAGQALYYMVHGEHVPNQLQFARAHFGLGNS